MKIIATGLVAAFLALGAGVAHATNPPVKSNLQQQRHELLKAVANNLRG